MIIYQGFCVGIMIISQGLVIMNLFRQINVIINVEYDPHHQNHETSILKQYQLSDEHQFSSSNAKVF